MSILRNSSLYFFPFDNVTVRSHRTTFFTKVRLFLNQSEGKNSIGKFMIFLGINRRSMEYLNLMNAVKTFIATANQYLI